MKDLDFKLIDAQTLLIMPAVRNIADFLDVRQVKADWNTELTTARISFTGKNGNRCEFRTKIELAKPASEVIVFFDYNRGKLCETDFSGEPAAKLNPRKILEHFKGIFVQEI